MKTKHRKAAKHKREILRAAGPDMLDGSECGYDVPADWRRKEDWNNASDFVDQCAEIVSARARGAQGESNG